MNTHHSSKIHQNKTGAKIVKNFKFAFKSAIALLLLLLIARVIAENQIIMSQSNHALYQSTAGNQKMLSQRIAMLSLAMVRAKNIEIKDELRELLLSSAEELGQGQRFLLSNQSGAKLSESATQFMTDSSKGLDIQVSKYVAHAKKLANAPLDEVNLSNVSLSSIISMSSELLKDLTTFTDIIKENDIQGVKLINNIANIFSLLTILVILGLGIFIFAPLVTRLDIEFRERERFEHKLQEANTDLEQFSSIAAHDLRAPLQNIKCFAELLTNTNDRNDSQKSVEYIAKISQGVTRLETLVKDLLDYSRSNSGTLDLQAVNLTKFLEPITSNFLNNSCNTKVKFEIGKLPVVMGDPTLLMILFNNLISNSVKYTTNVEQIMIKIYSKYPDSNKHTVEIYIEDNGMGFDENTASEVFKPFHRQSKVTTIPGSGLGLAICDRIVNKHAGTISASNAEDGGAKILISLPVHR